MTRIGKRLAAVFLAVAMAVTFVPALGTQTAYAEGEYPDIENVSISSEGIMTWDAYTGAEKYWVNVDNLSTSTTGTWFNLALAVSNWREDGALEDKETYTVKINAADSDGSYIATREITYTYVPITIANVALSPEGILTWDAYSGAEKYWVSINRLSSPVTDTSYDVRTAVNNRISSGSLEELDEYTLELSAENSDGSTLAKWKGVYTHISTPIANAKISSEGILTWDAFTGADKYWVTISDGITEPASSTTETSFDLSMAVDNSIESGVLTEKENYTVKLTAYSSDDKLLAVWKTSYTHTSRTIENALISPKGILTWAAYPGAVKYWVSVDNLASTGEPSGIDLNTWINRLYLEGNVENTGSHIVRIEAFDDADQKLAQWRTTYTYSVQYPMADVDVYGLTDGVSYSGSAIVPAPELSYIGYPLAAEDYSVAYTDSNGNTVTSFLNAGTYYAAFTGKGMYTGMKKVPVRIMPLDIYGADVTLSNTSYTYSGKAEKPTPIVKYDGKTLEADKDYTVTYQDNIDSGTATVTILGKGNYKNSKSLTFKINKAANPLKISVKTATVKYSKLRKKAQTLAVTKVIKFTKDAKDKKTYTLSSAKKGSKSFKKYFKINKTTGKVTIKKNSKMKKGAYKVKVKVRALGNANYKASAEKTVTFTVKVK